MNRIAFIDVPLLRQHERTTEQSTDFLDRYWSQTPCPLLAPTWHHMVFDDPFSAVVAALVGLCVRQMLLGKIGIKRDGLWAVF